MKETTGNWNPQGRKEYFLVCMPGEGEIGGQVDMIPEEYPAGEGRSVLYPFNNIYGEVGVHYQRLLIDSGAFTLANETHKETGMPIGEVFGLSIGEIPKGQETLDAYEEKVLELGGEAWGYIEFDIGNHEMKTERREEQETRGIRPIPVFSALNDPIDYYRYLITHYDRVAVGSIARGLRRSDKSKILAACEGIYRETGSTAWVHLLGCSPSPMTAWAKSMDVSSWAALSQYGAEQFENHIGKDRIKMDDSFSDAPLLGEHRDNREWALALRKRCFRACAARAMILARSHYDHRAEVEAAITNNTN